MIITTEQGFQLVRVIKKLGIKDELVNAMKEFTTLNKEKENTLFKLSGIMRNDYSNYDEMNDLEKEKASIETLNKNSDLAKKLSDIEGSINEIGTNLLFTVIENIPLAEKEIYKVLGDIFNKDVKDIKDQDLEDTINMIKEVATSKTFMYFFKLATK